MSLTGEPDGAPIRYPVPISDMSVGVYALIAHPGGAVRAGAHRPRAGDRRGDPGSQMGWLSNLAGSYFATGSNPPRLGNQHPTITPYQPFATADGYIIIAGGTDRIWGRLCGVLGLPDAVRDDPRFATNPERNVNRAEVLALVSERFLTQPKATGWNAARGRHPRRPDLPAR